MHLLVPEAILRCQELIQHEPQSLVELIHQNPSPPLQPHHPIPPIPPTLSLPPGSQPRRHPKLPPSPPTNTITPNRQVQAAHQPVVQHHRWADIEVLGVPHPPHRGEPDNKGNRHVGHNGNIPTGPHLHDRARREVEVTTVADVEHHLNRQVHAIRVGQGVQLEAPTANPFRMSSPIANRGQRGRTDNTSKGKAKVATERRGRHHQVKRQGRRHGRVRPHIEGGGRRGRSRATNRKSIRIGPRGTWQPRRGIAALIVINPKCSENHSDDNTCLRRKCGKMMERGVGMKSQVRSWPYPPTQIVGDTTHPPTTTI